MTNYRKAYEDKTIVSLELRNIAEQLRIEFWSHQDFIKQAVAAKLDTRQLEIMLHREIELHAEKEVKRIIQDTIRDQVAQAFRATREQMQQHLDNILAESITVVLSATAKDLKRKSQPKKRWCKK
jgi:hypothetical protein